MKSKFREIIKYIFLWTYHRFFFYEFMILTRKGINYSQDLLYTYNNADFIKDPKFINAYNLGKKTDIYNLMGKDDIHWRVHVLCWAAQNVCKLEGDFVECGVNTGIFSKAIVQYVGFENLNKKFYLMDTFNGLDPKYSSKSELEKSSGQGYTDVYERTKETFASYKNVTLIKGSIPETLKEVQSDKICFLSIDMNCVYPEIEAIKYFWDKIVPGGVIILDDYGYGNLYLDQKNAHDAFARSKGIEILSLPTCQGLIIKN